MELIEALEMAITALQEKADILRPAEKMALAWGEAAPAAARRDVNRRRRILAAIDTIKAAARQLPPAAATASPDDRIQHGR